MPELYERVARHLPAVLDIDAAQITHAVIAALAVRLTPDDAAALAAALPDELAELLDDADGDGRVDREGLIEEVAARLDIDDDDAERGAAAVLVSLREHLEELGPVAQVLESLPADLAQLMHG
jgi:uncharacterized protein (DUF2267 family)